MTLPYTSALLTARTRSTPTSVAAFSTFSVPSALARNASTGAVHDPPTSAHPARWYTTSGFTRSSRAWTAAGVGDVDAALVAIDADHLVAMRQQVLGEVVPDEAQRTSDECLHQGPATGGSVVGMVGQCMRPNDQRCRPARRGSAAAPAHQCAKQGTDDRRRQQHEDERHLRIGEDESDRDVAPIVEHERREQNDEDGYR